MRHHGRDLDQRLHRAEAHGELEERGRLDDPPGVGEGARDLEAHDRAPRRHLPHRQRVARVARQSGVVHRRHRRMPREPLREPQRRRRLGQHAEFERLQAPRAEIRLQRPHHRAGGVLQPVQPRAEFGVADDERSAEQVAVTADRLGGRVHHDVGAEFERPREGGRRQRGIAGEQRSAVVRDPAAGLDVGDREQGIPRRLHPHELCLRADGLGDGRGVGGVHGLHHDASLGEQPVEEPPGAAVDVGARDDFVAGGQEHRGAVGGRHARGEGERPGAAVKVGERLFEGVPGGAAGAGVVVGRRHRGVGLHEGAGEMDRRHHRPRGGIGFLAHVDRPGSKRSAR